MHQYKKILLAVDLSDVEWGDVLSDADGVLAVEGRVGDADVLVLRFADPGDRDPHHRGQGHPPRGGL